MKRKTVLQVGFTVLVAGVALAHWSCGSVKGLYASCDKPIDCPAPWVCCSKILDGIEVEPTCEEREYCDADGYLPMLVEGNPCGRDPNGGLDTQCREDLVCCDTTLTCAQVGQCAESEPEPPEGGSSGAECGSDKDCDTGEICCGISYSARNGTCTSVPECKATLPQSN